MFGSKLHRIQYRLCPGSQEKNDQEVINTFSFFFEWQSLERKFQTRMEMKIFTNSRYLVLMMVLCTFSFTEPRELFVPHINILNMIPKHCPNLPFVPLL